MHCFAFIAIFVDLVKLFVIVCLCAGFSGIYLPIHLFCKLTGLIFILRENNFIKMNNSENTPKKILATQAVGNDNLGYVIEECGEITLNTLNYNNNMMTTPQQRTAKSFRLHR